MTISLSVDKVLLVLKKRGYIISAIFIEDEGVIRFLVCRSPTFQKTFVIYIPEKFHLKIPEESSFKKFNIEPSVELPSTRQVEYLSDIKGPLLECDICSISNEAICTYRNDNSIKCYRIKEDGEEIIVEEDKEDEEDDEVQIITKNADKLIQKLKPGSTLPKAKLREKEEPLVSDTEEEEDILDQEENKVVSLTAENEDGELVEVNITSDNEEDIEDEEEEEEEKVELEFEDVPEEDEEEVNDLPELGEEEESIESIEEDVKKLEEKILPDQEEKKVEHFDNSLPEDIKETDLSLGIIYVLIDLRKFYRELSEIEKEIITCYEQLDDNELDIRNNQIKNIEEKSSEFVDHVKTRVNGITEKEKSLRLQLVQLTIVLSQLDELKKQTSNNILRYNNDIGEIDRIENSTRKFIHDLNMELLRLKDECNELITNFNSSLDDMLEL